MVLFLLILTLFRIICGNVEFEYLFVAFIFMYCVGQAYWSFFLKFSRFVLFFIVIVAVLKWLNFYANYVKKIKLQ